MSDSVKKKIGVFSLLFLIFFCLGSKEYEASLDSAIKRQIAIREEAIKQGDLLVVQARKEAKRLIALAPHPPAKLIAYLRGKELIASAKREQKRILERAQKKGETTLFLLKEKQFLSE